MLARLLMEKLYMAVPGVHLSSNLVNEPMAVHLDL